MRPCAKKLFTALKNAPPPTLTEEEAAAGKKGKKKKKSSSWFGGLFGRGAERVRGGAVTMEEFQWAYAAFWSRALSLPIGSDPVSPVVEGEEEVCVRVGVKDTVHKHCAPVYFFVKITQAVGPPPTLHARFFLFCVLFFRLSCHR